MLHRLRNNLQNKSIWWKSKLWIETKVIFKSHKKLYGLRYKYRDEKFSSIILRKSLGAILKTTVIAVVFIVATEALSEVSGDIVYTLGSEELGLLIATVVTITGVFLGLYFTALSAVAGNLFMRAPERLQALFLRERKGSQYIKTLVLTMIIGIIYLLLRSFGYQVGFMGPVFITILAIYAVIRFMALGFQTFYFINTQEAASILTGDVAYSIDNASAGKRGWKKDYLQEHHRKQAKNALDTLSNLVDFGIDPIKLSGSQLLDISKFTAGLLNYYIKKKKSIPTESKWFATKYEHQNWLITEEAAVNMALNTGTSLQPKDVRDQLWFEEACLDVIIKIFEHLVLTKQWSQAQHCLEGVVTVAESAGSNFYTDTAKLINEKISNSVSKKIIETDNPKEEDDKHGHLAIIDSLGRLPIAVLVSLSRYLNERDCNKLISEIDRVKWLRETSIYTSELPGSMLANMETTQKGYQNEVLIEGKPVSEQWYLRTITTQQYLIHLNKYYDYIKSLNAEFYEANFNTLLKKHKIVQAAHITDRWTEYSNKLLSLGWNVQKFVSGCEDQKKIQDLSWITIDAETEKTILQNYNQTSIDKMAQLIMPLSLLPKTELKDLPDYFGQAYTFGVEAVYIAAMENDKDRLEDLFSSVFAGALKAYTRTREDVEGWAEQSIILVSSEPLEDILALSGFIKIYSELHNNQELWKVCKDTWDSYLTSHSNPRSMIEMFAAFSNYRDAQLGVLMPKAVLRTTWDARLHQTLRSSGIRIDTFGASPFSEEPEVTHDSPLIRVIARRNGLLSFEVRSIFFVTYLSKHVAVEGVDIDFSDLRDIEQMLNSEMGVNEEDEDA